MRAATIDHGQLSVVECEDPVPGPGELLVRVRASGVTVADLEQRDGRMPPGVPGRELAGEVIVRAGRHEVGARVMAVVEHGAHAELAVVPAAQALPIPPVLDWPQAGSLPYALATAADAVFVQASVRSGERVLIQGTMLDLTAAIIQIAARCGARVTVAAATRGGEQLAREFGARAAVAADGVASSGPFDVIVMLGADRTSLDEALWSLAEDGTIVIVGIGREPVSSLNLVVLIARHAVIRGASLRLRSPERLAAITRLVEERVPSSEIVLGPRAEFSLDEIEAAYDHAASASGLGGAVVVPT